MFPNAQDVFPLPRRPNVERYKNLAKDLVKACKSNDKDAIVDWAEKWVTVLAQQSASSSDVHFPSLRHGGQIRSGDSFNER